MQRSNQIRSILDVTTAPYDPVYVYITYVTTISTFTFMIMQSDNVKR